MSLLKDIVTSVFAIAKGMGKTYAEQSEPVATELYPFEQPHLPPVSMQSLALIKDEKGEDRCVSCLACEKICPSQVITIERHRNPAGKGFVLDRFDIDMVNCMYCAMCVEACPASAIVTVQDFEMCTFNLQTLKFDKAFLDEQGERADQWYSPKFGVEYRRDGKIVRAPLEEQPGGLAEMEKQRAAAEAPTPAKSGAPSSVASSVAPTAIAEKRVTTVASAEVPAVGSPVPLPPVDVIVAKPADEPAEPTTRPEGFTPDPNRARKPAKRWEPVKKEGEE